MNVLIVSNQVIEDTGKMYQCTTNLYDILKRFKYIGELRICTVKYNGTNSHTKIEKDLQGVVRYGNISFIKKDYVFMSSAYINWRRNKIRSLCLS